MATGLGVGTILTLGFVPVLYSLMFRARETDDTVKTDKEAAATPAE